MTWLIGIACFILGFAACLFVTAWAMGLVLLPKVRTRVKYTWHPAPQLRWEPTTVVRSYRWRWVARLMASMAHGSTPSILCGYWTAEVME